MGNQTTYEEKERRQKKKKKKKMKSGYDKRLQVYTVIIYEKDPALNNLKFERQN